MEHKRQVYSTIFELSGRTKSCSWKDAFPKLKEHSKATRDSKRSFLAKQCASETNSTILFADGNWCPTNLSTSDGSEESRMIENVEDDSTNTFSDTSSSDLESDESSDDEFDVDGQFVEKRYAIHQRIECWENLLENMQKRINEKAKATDTHTSPVEEVASGVNIDRKPSSTPTTSPKGVPLENSSNVEKDNLEPEEASISDLTSVFSADKIEQSPNASPNASHVDERERILAKVEQLKVERRLHSSGDEWVSSESPLQISTSPELILLQRPSKISLKSSQSESTLPRISRERFSGTVERKFVFGRNLRKSSKSHISLGRNRQRTEISSPNPASLRSSTGITATTSTKRSTATSATAANTSTKNTSTSEEANVSAVTLTETTTETTDTTATDTALEPSTDAATSTGMDPVTDIDTAIEPSPDQEERVT